MIMILMIQMQESLRTQRSDSQPAAPTAPMTTVFTDAGGERKLLAWDGHAYNPLEDKSPTLNADE